MTTSARDVQKPLPSVPEPQPEERILTINGRDHLRRFLDNALEEDPHAWDGGKEVWADALETALRDLAKSVEGRGWLVGVKHAKVEKGREEATRKAERRKQREQELRVKEKESEGRAKGRPISSQPADPTKDKEGKKDGEAKQARPESKASLLSTANDEQRDILALQQLRTLASKRSSDTEDSTSPKHLLLTIVLHDQNPAGPSSKPPTGSPSRCTFSPGVFSLPAPDLFGEDPSGNGAAAAQSTLYGFREWDTFQMGKNVELVGGTFSFDGTLSIEEHATLSRVLRLGIYVILSILLEQRFLSDFGVELHFPKPKPQPKPKLVQHSAPSPPMTPMHHRNSSPDVKHRTRDTFTPSSIWSIFSKKTGSLLHRAVTVNPYGSRGGSLDLQHHPDNLSTPPRISVDIPNPRVRRFSIFGEARPTVPPPIVTPPDAETPFQTTLRQVEKSRALLSTSVDILIPPPILLTRLAEKEKENPTRRLTGEERTGLASILGWEGKKAGGRGMSGTAGFVRQQRISVLYSEHVPACGSGSASSLDQKTSRILQDDEHKTYLHCGPRADWRTYAFYANTASEENADRSLGETVATLCGCARDPCFRPDCKTPRGQHERRWMHNSVRIVASVKPSDDANDSDIQIWHSCQVCSEVTPRCKMNDGTYLLSFAKFLELLLYSPSICTLAQPLCSHTNPPPHPWTGPDMPLPRSRFNIIRHFAFKSHTLSFSLSVIPDVFELRIPRLQITRGSWLEKTSSEKSRSPVEGNGTDNDVEKKELRREIRSWWQAIADHLDKLEMQFVDEEGSSYLKSLPRLPSTDDAWEHSSHSTTPRAQTFSLPSTLANTPIHEGEVSFSSVATVKPPSRSYSDTQAHTDDKNLHDTLSSEESMALLSNLRFAFQQTERELYGQLSEAPDVSLNDVRRSFHSAAHGATKRLSAWETKHVPKEARAQLSSERSAIEEPRWWKAGYHAVPGGSVIVQEEDWGSIIAFTLSSIDYQRELAGMSHPRGGGPALPPPPLLVPPTSSNGLSRSAAIGSTSSFKFFAHHPKPDPDTDDAVWHEPETYSAVISRKEHPRDPTSLMSLREVLRQKVPADGSHGLPSSVFTSVSRMVSGGAPPSAWAKPAVEVNTQAADGRVTAVPEAVEIVGKILQEMDTVSLTSSKGSLDSSGTGVVETNIRRGKTSSVISNSSTDSNSTVGPEQAPASTASENPPLQTDVAALTPVRGTDADLHPSTQNPDRRAEDNSAFSWTSSLTSAMRYMLKVDNQPQQTSPAPRNHHGLLSTDPLNIDARPHIKYDWTVGKRLKFSCTAYYAKQFDALRRRCGIEDVFLKSMAKSQNWVAEGGKSRSNFWKTSDDRFIIKTLVNAWNVADLQVLIDLAPSYFTHMESTASKASLLTKLLGFYTVEIRNLETGTVQAKADLLVMENLFYDQKPTKTFDLKGIQGRKVKASSNSPASKTLFDGEWIEGQERALTLVHPHSKIVLHEGLKADCDFLSNSNIMDYSLLLGIDEEQKQIYCGLVDTIGSYTFAKTLEYKAKGLSGRDGKDITVIPPHEYQERFVSAMDSYFLACPDKWTKPPDDKKINYDPAQLPSVL
ncbi:hypothetical protein BV25DRAFT_1799271 [Artomyces pyxidatus]|uniref:Uncharacterized protein n=1 Tax=Artomyces pyxidatus TaxID=48021 RepID=A0ACB8TAA9_9AGAM|nr:hypothetical protein BV25DRAFT_1799271 [Artomyces pyxidatus]